jgi:hypothetical protein
MEAKSALESKLVEELVCNAHATAGGEEACPGLEFLASSEE